MSAIEKLPLENYAFQADELEQPQLVLSLDPIRISVSALERLRRHDLEIVNELLNAEIAVEGGAETSELTDALLDKTKTDYRPFNESVTAKVIPIDEYRRKKIKPQDLLFEFAEFADNDERDEAFFQIRGKYHTHPAVFQALSYYRLQREKVEPRSRPDSVDMYLNDVGKYRLLQPSEEPELFRHIERGLSIYQRLGSLDNPSPQDEAVLVGSAAAYEIVYRTNLRLAVSLAMKRKYFVPREALLDLMQEATLGLERSIRLFDYRRRNKFSTYATNWIKQTVDRAIANNERTIRLPVHIHERWRKLGQTTTRLWQSLQREPTLEELAEATGQSVKEVLELQTAGAMQLKSLNEYVNDEEETEFGYFIADDRERPIGEAVPEELDTANAIEFIFSTRKLSDKEKLVLSLRFGIYTPILEEIPVNGRYGSYQAAAEEAVISSGMTLEEIGRVLGMTRERVRQLEGRALTTMAETYPELRSYID